MIRKFVKFAETVAQLTCASLEVTRAVPFVLVPCLTIHKLVSAATPVEITLALWVATRLEQRVLVPPLRTLRDVKYAETAETIGNVLLEPLKPVPPVLVLEI